MMPCTRCILYVYDATYISFIHNPRTICGPWRQSRLRLDIHPISAYRTQQTGDREYVNINNVYFIKHKVSVALQTWLTCPTSPVRDRSRCISWYSAGLNRCLILAPPFNRVISLSFSTWKFPVQLVGILYNGWERSNVSRRVLMYFLIVDITIKYKQSSNCWGWTCAKQILFLPFITG